MASWASSEAEATIQRSRTIITSTGQRRPANYLFENADRDDDSGTEILNQGNLTVFLLTKVKRVLFNDKKDAIGVDVRSPAGDVPVYVRKGGKIFLNAGVYETPKLLMLSGIGPPQVLSKHDIPVVFPNEAVGQNLIDRKELIVALPLLKDLEGDDIPTHDVAIF